MKQLLKHICLGLFVALLVSNPSRVFAQNLRTSDYGRGNIEAMNNALEQVGTNPYAAATEYDENGNPITPTEEADSAKVKIKKPLESYFFSDSLRGERFIHWNISTKTNNINLLPIDTLLDDFQSDYLFLKKDVGDAYLGPLGGASVPLNFFRRPDSRNFNFVDGYYAYLFTPENAPFYNTKEPITRLGYISGGQKKMMEENLNVVHAQQISPSLGFNVTYNNQNTRGIYNWQRSKVKDLSMGVSYTGKRYTLHAGYIFNSISRRENGGLVNDWDITDTVHESSLNIPMRLTDAENEARNNTFYLVHSLGVPLVRILPEDFSIAGKPSFYIGHALTWEKWGKKYTDTRQGTIYDVYEKQGEKLSTEEFYTNWYINPNYTNDTIAESLLSNRIFLQLQPWSRESLVAVVDAGIGLDVHSYYHFRMDDYLTGFRKHNEEEFYVYGAAQGKFKKYFDWNADLRFVPLGYRSGDIEAGGDVSLSLYIKDRPITLSGAFDFYNRTPSYWSQSYFSNHFAWSNSFAKENESRLEITLRAPHWKAEAGLYQSILGNRVYYDAAALPQQASDVVSVSGAYLRKDFALGKFHFNHRVMLQWSTDQKVVAVPLASAYLSYYWEGEAVPDVLTLKIGLDGWWNTKYYAPGYNPATMQFYNQREQEIGEYPMINAFVAAQWKRARLILQYQHANQDLFDTRAFFNIPHYPLNMRVLKFGISWNFYD